MLDADQRLIGVERYSYLLVEPLWKLLHLSNKLAPMSVMSASDRP